MAERPVVTEQQYFTERLHEFQPFTALHARIIEGSPEALAQADLTAEQITAAANKTIDKRKDSAIYHAATKASYKERGETATKSVDAWVNEVTQRWTTRIKTMDKPSVVNFCNTFDIGFAESKSDAENQIEIKNFYKDWLSSLEKADMNRVVKQVMTKCTQDNKLDIQKFETLVNSPYWAMFGKTSAEGIQQLLRAEARQMFAKDKFVAEATKETDNKMRCNDIAPQESEILAFWRNYGTEQEPEQQATPPPVKPAPMEQSAGDKDKQALWEQKSREVDQMRDSIGNKVDSGIKETVIAINILGIPTLQSCEGHLDHGLGAPWVTTEDPSARERIYQCIELRKQADAAREKGATEEADRLSNKESDLRKEAKKINLVPARRLLDLLAAFYQQRQVPFDRRLNLNINSYGVGFLESEGAAFHETATAEDKKQKLEEYQEEMNAFTAFLKKKYFSG